MQSFVQFTPTEIVFGRDTQKEAGRLVKKYGASKVLLVYGGGSVIRSGLLDTVKESLRAEEISFIEISGVKPNPRLSLAREGVKKAVDFGAELILAVGGGSVIDTAKAVAVGAANSEVDIWDVWMGKASVCKAKPVGAILTISAAGSEMSDSTVLTNEETGKKAGYNSDIVRPKFAILNPELTFTLPKYQVACGVVDIMMHTLERYFTPVSGNQLTDEIAESVLRTVTRNGLVAYENPQDYDAMSEIMWCGSLSHNGLTGLGRPKDFVCHKLGHEIGGMFDEAHGATLSAVWGSWARYVYHLDIARFVRYGKQVWNIEIEDEEEAALAAIERTEEFFRALDMPVSIGELSIGVQPDDVLRKMADSATRGGTVTLGAFRKMDAQDMYEVYKAANHS
ncbi:iron-containing alcohol dehydrogenase [Faecalicatena contorta]|uniref:iron-containing alcohol dehydrogenase n=1 Tax=Faecalicatena contorta TaxID=39482 RepID=UPI001F2CDF62|nr:iron-containing alcohol dehydrogenase [Faecalicatena contorta]MCF2555063.1 iron-containing alcohol dehydrogenase [Faecalicatena contorta]